MFNGKMIARNGIEIHEMISCVQFTWKMNSLEMILFLLDREDLKGIRM